MPVATSSLARSGNCSSNINLIATDDLEYTRLTAVAMTKLQHRSTASVAVDIVTLIGSKPEEIVRFSLFTGCAAGLYIIDEVKLTNAP